MEYRLRSRDDYDRSLKIKDVQILLYSKSKFNEVAPGGKVIGEVILSEKKKENGDTVRLGKQIFSLRDPGQAGPLAYKLKGYVAVGNNEYVQIFDSRLPFLLVLVSLLLVGTVAVLSPP